MLEIIKAVIYGIVEGITEWLPVSSTGHMILLGELVRPDVSEEFLNLFMVVIQLGAIIAVILTMWKRIWPFGTAWRGNGRDTRRIGNSPFYINMETIRLWGLVLISCVPAAVIGILFDDFLDEHLQNWVCVSIMLIVVGLLFIVVESLIKGKEPSVNSLYELTVRDALIIGLCQVVAAVLPGTSRSGATIIGALLLGIARTVAVEYTFILAIPVMAGASLLKILKFDGEIASSEMVFLAVGLLTAFAVSMLVIRGILRYIRTHDFRIFGWYRIVLGVIVILFFGIFRQ
ncbi:MAG: undecaprenyl-diphosphate phosphatase [Lachnospiraceae bacterium]|nr:undecaprenyl-diphosphate phosphatase [Lachnospiraceae bacterium]